MTKIDTKKFFKLILYFNRPQNFILFYKLKLLLKASFIINFSLIFIDIKKK